MVLDNTRPLPHRRGGRLPLYVLPISGSLAGVDDHVATAALRELDARGIGYTVDWNPGQFAESLAEGLRIARIQQRLGMEVSVNANACLHSFCDGSDATLHVDDTGQPFAETSFGGRLGCPFALEQRIPVIQERVAAFLRGYQAAGIEIEFIFADWEIDGPIEWNDAWDSSRKCRRCRQAIGDIDDFYRFQKELREIRSRLQRITFADNVTAFFPEALVGNYGVYPHDGYRYWYDYFEQRADDRMPFRVDQQARYRTWYPEFELTGYTFAMPVVYTWYPTFHWYDFADLDYRWFYNMLLVGSNAGRHTPAETPIITFVHWTTTAPPDQPDPAVVQFSAERYQDLLWHLLLRGHDAFFLWCVASELPEEIRLVHEVYAESLAYRGFLDRGTPITFNVPQQPGPVVSGLRLGDHVLVRRTDFADRCPARRDPSDARRRYRADHRACRSGHPRTPGTAGGSPGRADPGRRHAAVPHRLLRIAGRRRRTAANGRDRNQHRPLWQPKRPRPGPGGRVDRLGLAGRPAGSDRYASPAGDRSRRSPGTRRVGRSRRNRVDVYGVQRTGEDGRLHAAGLGAADAPGGRVRPKAGREDSAGDAGRNPPGSRTRRP